MLFETKLWMIMVILITTPSLAMAVYKEYRGLGIGTFSLKKHLFTLKNSGYSRVSLSVQKTNYAT